MKMKYLLLVMEKKAEYTQISQEEAKKMMARDDGHVIVDVRRQDEYNAGHIPGAILIPNETISGNSPEALPEEKLAAMGYKNVYEFGGINSWTGEIVTD